MKLFITNKSEFENQFDNPDRFENTYRKPLSSYEIHKKAFSMLSLSMDIHDSIPILLTPPYDYSDGIVVFEFVTKRGDIYYYEYQTTAK